MNRHVAGSAFSLALIVMIASSFQSRSALGLVVEACKINFTVTGSPFPCMKVVEMPAALASYAVLREPDEKERTILAPLSDISGTEDARLLEPDAPNFFEAAWKERAIEMSSSSVNAKFPDFALAVNPASWRTQDRLHIHIGCARPRFRAVLKSHELDISRFHFTKLRNNPGWWVKFFPGQDLSNLNPLEAVARDVGDGKADMSHLAIGVFNATLADGQHGFYVLASVIGKTKVTGSAEEMIDPACRF
ncbi:CDP-diacylglycerol diphosphatase [Rhizobium sp. L80/93]|uniref:CDP-diacylglycerol diphosphatase n=1 Tax=unclassified Rhizobium TaxID=2613769 RepID=UPI001ADACDF4|nr:MULTISPECIES: CDP-diacylglycerol diphosphatase [unclassified Rhizobium]MBO9136791.1 CDP-diacylglycerol diphosphatase [Rhizobium sp. B209b/85]MBO9188047.1 CDP-diacylglycerol diphosphatase [Rhizobium sp. E27B/91]QXZ99061.1 CDP-diacylglycerol diphosphatase [Rhizobium sp. B230/85]